MNRTYTVDDRVSHAVFAPARQAIPCWRSVLLCRYRVGPAHKEFDRKVVSVRKLF